LLRTAYLLTGDQQLSEDLVQTSLEKALRHSSRIQVSAATEGYVRQIMYRENVSYWGRDVPARCSRPCRRSRVGAPPSVPENLSEEQVPGTLA
jgi:DNA-directed RNA polymerase specialized sigma24 family protein